MLERQASDWMPFEYQLNGYMFCVVSQGPGMENVTCMVWSEGEQDRTSTDGEGMDEQQKQ